MCLQSYTRLFTIDVGLGTCQPYVRVVGLHMDQLAEVCVSASANRGDRSRRKVRVHLPVLHRCISCKSKGLNFAGDGNTFVFLCQCVEFTCYVLATPSGVVYINMQACMSLRIYFTFFYIK